ncbi:MAG: rhomboid family intramembrane serine protease, partial [Oscillospiraceae bacterium]|nr:rhomboid family intramembrane serine protease [Oscillospiraceae bacterium]
MENSKKQSHIERYGKVNIIIAVLCAIFLVVNSVIVSESALNQLASNKYLAYILNFLAGCEGKLGTIGSMSNAKVFGDGEWWRLFFHIYLHAGVLHMLFNVFELLVAGKIVEKKIGSL